MKKVLSSEAVYELDSFKALCADIGVDFFDSSRLLMEETFKSNMTAAKEAAKEATKVATKAATPSK